MKKLLFVLFFVNVCAFAYSQTSNENPSRKPVIKFSETTYDFGTINEADGKVSHTYEVTNTGKADLLITDVRGSCGCTVSEWSKTPIAPGKKGVVTVTYNPVNRIGNFNKTITVSNNSDESKVTLSIRGNVIRTQKDESKAKNGSDQSLMTIAQLIKDAREGVEFIGNEELIKRINANPKLVLLDVRTKEEYDAGHLKGATWVDRGIAEFTLARTLRDSNAEIIVYCQKGNRSALVVKTLKRMGYQNVKSHVGLEEWMKADLPIYNFLGEVKMVKPRELNAAINPIDYYMDKK